MTQVSNVARWLKPFIAFILPSLVFCLIVPRRWHLRLPAWIFSRRSLSIPQFLWAAIKIPLASLMVLLDTVIWLSVVFSLAGPIMASSIYEALLDTRLMSFLKRHIETNTLAVRERAHAALVILIGNLDSSAWASSLMLVQRLPQDSIHKDVRTAAGLQEARSNGLDKPGTLSGLTTPTPTPTHSTCPGDQVTTPGHVTLDSNGPDQPRIEVVKARLRSLLDSQYTFGASAGAPVIFYIAAFVWSVYEVHEDLGVRCVQRIFSHLLEFSDRSHV